ncbi:hypothetical protein BU202_00050 [Streptococcus cuniculi]|uniref:Uncharacterized protein n=1 Tax=Streptococcus cuniculi TaxID=1432788 RepID=A0A1Q8EAA3_9STRE|nr:TipC family immunity protein [Streptococcus cuniculi]OLF48724.1 hypothetical protein BU202_00050 [Streptococcus cuniculi]
MKKKTMRRLVYIVAIPLLLICFYKVYLHVERDRQYQSLDNVFKEMNYASVHSEGLVKLPNLSIALDSSQAYRKPDRIKGLPIKNTLVQEDEIIAAYVGLNNVLFLEYGKQLSPNIFLYINWYYKDSKLTESVEIANSDTSWAFATATYDIEDEAFKQTNNLAETLKRQYGFSSSKGLPSLQLTDTKEVLEYLKPYGLDANWIRAKSDYMLNDVVLKRWFDKGSQRYSFDNLGDVKIERLDIFQ